MCSHVAALPAAWHFAAPPTSTVVAVPHVCHHERHALRSVPPKREVPTAACSRFQACASTSVRAWCGVRKRCVPWQLQRTVARDMCWLLATHNPPVAPCPAHDAEEVHSQLRRQHSPRQQLQRNRDRCGKVRRLSGLAAALAKCGARGSLGTAGSASLAVAHTPGGMRLAMQTL